ncbi:winged helix-turn-helix domain-containing protein [Desulforamulus ruminis]|uniref:winged helix-turn-helix domain-containing protein n=1 Tax=Desulforamulus ruminis TaxID=1564 RepID=UPI002FDA7636
MSQEGWSKVIELRVLGEYYPADGREMEKTHCIELVRVALDVGANPAMSFIKPGSQDSGIRSWPNRRSGEGGEPFPLTVNSSRSEVWLEGRCLELTRTQKRIFFKLAERPGVYVDREVLYWSAREDGTVYGPAGEVKGQICRIRKILGDSGEIQRYIQSKRSVGYRLAKEKVRVINEK